MFHDILSSRGFIVGVVFFLLIVGGTQLYSWYVRRGGDAKIAETRQTVQALENSKEIDTKQDTGIPVDTEVLDPLNTSIVADETQAVLEVTEALLTDIVSTGTDAEVTEELSLFQSEVVDGLASDFPEVPADFPENLIPVWIEFPNYRKGDMHDHEMIYRVLIKLWNQGDRGFVNGVFWDNNGRVYPLYSDVLYVQWDEETVGPDDNPRTILVPKSMLGTTIPSFTPEEMYSGRVEEFLPDIRFVDIDTAGYDPETFLTNDER